jgi:hypothetical protein
MTILTGAEDGNEGGRTGPEVWAMLALGVGKRVALAAGVGATVGRGTVAPLREANGGGEERKGKKEGPQDMAGEREESWRG